MSRVRRVFVESFLVVTAFALLVINVIALAMSLATGVGQLLVLSYSIISVVVLGGFLLLLRAFPSRKSYDVAVVGFPQSGKTTLIISLFGEAFASKLPIRLSPRGSQSIALINRSLEMLKKGKALGPTADQDRYGFRADATVGRFPFTTTYRLEFGDFPGKYSKEYPNAEMHTLHNTEFFKWVADSDCIMFVIDIGKYLSSDRRNFIAEVTSAFRTEWQQYLDVNSYRLKEVKRHPVIISFTKMDLLYRFTKQINLSDKKLLDIDELVRFEGMVARYGFGEEAPPIMELDENKVKSDTEEIEGEFAELIQFFRAEAINTSVVFTSSFGIINGSRLGFRKLFALVLKGVE